MIGITRVLIISVFVQRFQTVFRDLYGYVDQNFLDMKITETVLLSHVTRSEIACGVKCLEVRECQSWAYHDQSNICYLWDVVVEFGVSVSVPEVGWTAHNTDRGLDVSFIFFFYL